MILITGGAGYLGSVLVGKLLEMREGVRVLDRMYFGARSLDGYRASQGIEIVEGDVRRFEPDALKGVDAVVHLAGLSNDPTAEWDPAANMEINKLGTERVAQACIKRGVRRFVFASTCSIYYTEGPSDDLKTEESPVSPTAPYSLSKWIAEQKLLFQAGPELAPVSLRFGTLFGPSPRMRFDLVVNRFVRDAWQTGRLTVHQGGEVWRPLTHVEDAAQALIACLFAPEERVARQVFNVVHKNYWIQSLAHWVKHVLEPKKRVEVDVLYEGQERARGYRVSDEKVRRQLGFTANRGCAEAVRAIWERFEAGAFDDFEEPHYYNIEHMKRVGFGS